MPMMFAGLDGTFVCAGNQKYSNYLMRPADHVSANTEMMTLWQQFLPVPHAVSAGTSDLLSTFTRE